MKKILIVAFIVNIILVSTHEGEFWPFSIFPMFSQAGKPWSRGLVTVVSDTVNYDLWKAKTISQVSDRVVPLRKHGVNEIDFANFISKTKIWDKKRVQALRDLLQAEQLHDEVWMAGRVTGRLTEQGSVIVEVTSLFLLTSDSTYRNPHLFGN